MNRHELEFSAAANAELQAFMSPLFIWRSIWEEIVPREKLPSVLTDDRESWESELFHDRFGITTGPYGLLRLLALWYICGHMYQGYYPPTLLIRNMIVHRVGEDRPFKRSRERDEERNYRNEVVDTARSTARNRNMIVHRVGEDRPFKKSKKSRKRDEERNYRNEVVDTARSTARKAMKPIVTTGEVDDEEFGWFASVTRKQATKRRSASGRTRYIVDADKSVIQNVFAIVNTALTVAKIVQSDKEIAKHRESLTSICANAGATGKEIFGSLNRPTDESFTMTVTRHIRRELRANDFVVTSEGSMKVAELREETEPKVNFFDYENVEQYSVEDHFEIPEDKIADQIEQARDLHRRRPWDQAG